MINPSQVLRRLACGCDLGNALQSELDSWGRAEAKMKEHGKGSAGGEGFPFHRLLQIVLVWDGAAGTWDPQAPQCPKIPSAVPPPPPHSHPVVAGPWP